ncbi:MULTISPECIES: glutamate racemase [Enterobacterales]|uniref:glutamate racemase n=1 Tax=Enterobacterales TaxID=91347 RepID=UPI00084805C7|nr:MULTISPECIES: glutamate racemase [Enterobacterales]WOO49997.1 glutamate racemase [Hafnia alvei]MCK9783154.1 glutamate racemase [Proteus columbae]MCT6516330.1 glutamate racemase [Proteus vulgaris]ODQ08196.1 glutamate racemase [Shigella sp. FC130]OEI90151.1 glutamate racemase [Shigella sp. FC1655]
MAIARQDENTSSQEVTTSDALSTANPTVLVFDSGVGGLSVYREIREKLPEAHYIYVFDNEAFPYGEKSQEFIIDRVVRIISAVAEKHDLATIVIACNTASTVSLPALRAKFTEIPIVGVVPAIKPAAKLTCNGVVGLLATRATVKRPYTHELIERFATDCKVHSLGSAELVELAERKLHGESVSLDELRKILTPWLKMKEPPDTVVLGCTHFPLLADELLSVLPDGTRIIDSGAAIARRTAWLVVNQAKIKGSNEISFAYCLKEDENSESLKPVLASFGFESLRKLAL